MEQLELPLLATPQIWCAKHCAVCKKELDSDEAVFYTTMTDGYHICEHFYIERTKPHDD